MSTEDKTTTESQHDSKLLVMRSLPTKAEFIDKYIELTGYGMDMWSKEKNAALCSVAEILWGNGT